MKGLGGAKKGAATNGRPPSGGSNYEAFSVLFDWLKTLFTLLPKVGRIAMAAKARKTSNRAYSTRSCPSSSQMNFLINSIMVLFPLLMDTHTSSVVAHSLRIFFWGGEEARRYQYQCGLQSE